MRFGVIQLNSKLDPKENLNKVEKYLTQAAKETCSAVFLPEVFYSMSNGQEPTPYLIENENEHYKNIQNLAKKYDIYLLGGSAATKVGEQIINRTYNFTNKGETLKNYDKIHLFSCDLSKHQSKKVIDENRIYNPGTDPVIDDVLGWKIGYSICFDVRFPELYRYYRSQGVQIFTAAAAFTVPTGDAHWKTLLRSRAIENQAYVFASAQWGYHNEQIQTYGHSMIIDPWGTVLAELPEGEGLIFADVDKSRLEEIRSRVNMTQKFHY